MRPMLPNLGLATTMTISNVWLFTDPEGRRFLVDSGDPIERLLLRRCLRQAGLERPGDVTAVLLTHRHSDHAGNAAWLRERFRCQVVCHEDDAQILAGKRPPLRLARGVGNLIQEILCRVEDRFPAHCEVDDTFAEGTWRYGFQVVPVPGHTEGSCFLYHEATGTLFSGDGILAGPPPLRAIEHLCLAMPGFSQDAAICHGRVNSFLNQLPRVRALCSGHGPPVVKDVERKLRRLAR